MYISDKMNVITTITNQFMRIRNHMFTFLIKKFKDVLFLLPAIIDQPVRIVYYEFQKHNISERL